MALKVNRHEASITVDNPDTEWYEQLPQELGTYRIQNPENDTSKMALISKDKVKEELGRSPDYGDAFIMRGYFTLKRQFHVLTPREEKEDALQKFMDDTDFDPFSMF